MKKVLIGFFLSFILATAVFAEDAVFSLSDAKGRAGDTVELTLTLKCTQPANSFAVSNIIFDESVLEFEGFTEDERLSELTVLPPMFDEKRMAIVVGLKEAYNFEGKLCTLKFKIKETASKSTSVTASAVAKNNSQSVSAAFDGAKITVEAVQKDEELSEKPAKPVTPFKPTTPTVPEKVWQNPFTDVKESDWFYSSVKFANESGIVAGVSENEFAPSLNVTRAMFVTLLYRLEKHPSSGGCIFTDVKKGSWYEKSVAWANENGIVNGISASEFAPDSNITREQMAVMVSRWAKYKGKNTKSEKELEYADKGSISSWAKGDVAWITESGVMSGSGNSFRPKSFATRAEAVTVITRIAK